MRNEKTLTRRAVGGFNAWVNRLRVSPRWGGLVGRYVTEITYTGRRSGRTFRTPVSYRRSGDLVTIKVSLPDLKSWWRNFTGEGGPISVQLRGIDHPGHAVARRDAKGRITVTVQLEPVQP